MKLGEIPSTGVDVCRIMAYRNVAGRLVWRCVVLDTDEIVECDSLPSLLFWLYPRVEIEDED